MACEPRLGAPFHNGYFFVVVFPENVFLRLSEDDPYYNYFPAILAGTIQPFFR